MNENNNTFGELKVNDNVYIFDENKLEKSNVFYSVVVDKVKKILLGFDGYQNVFCPKLNAKTYTTKVLSKHTNKPTQAKVFVNKDIALGYLNNEINSLTQQTNILSALRTKLNNNEI